MQTIYTGVHELSIRYGLTEIGPVDVSIGIASYPQHAQTDNLLRAARCGLVPGERAGPRADCELWDAGGGLADYRFIRALPQ